MAESRNGKSAPKASEHARNEASSGLDDDVLDVDEAGYDADVDEDKPNHPPPGNILTPATNTAAAATITAAAARNTLAAASNTLPAASNTLPAASSTSAAPTNIAAAPSQQGAGFSVLELRSLGRDAAINPTSLKEAQSGTTSRPSTIPDKKPVGKHADHGKTACDRCKYKVKERCILQPGNSICDLCRRHGHECQWTWAGVPGGAYHQERWGRVALSGPWLHLLVEANTAPSAANGGTEHDGDGSGEEAPLPDPFNYYSAPEEETDEDMEG